MTTSDRVKRCDLGKRVFREIEAPQGHAFLSDAIEGMSDEQVIPFLRGALREARKVVRILEKYLAAGRLSGSEQ